MSTELQTIIDLAWEGRASLSPTAADPKITEAVENVIGDLNARRGKILDLGQRAGARVIRAEVPLATMFGYATDVRSKTQGRATHTMQFSHYYPVPIAVQDEIVARRG